MLLCCWQVPLDESGRRRGFGIVELAGEEAVASALRIDLPQLLGQQAPLRDATDPRSSRISQLSHPRCR